MIQLHLNANAHEVRLAADDTSSILSIAGSVALSSGQASVGVAAAYNNISNTTSACATSRTGLLTAPDPSPSSSAATLEAFGCERLPLATAAAGAILAALPLSATPISINASSSFVINFDGYYDASHITIPGLTGQVLLSNFVFNPATFAGQTATRVTLDYTVNNTSSNPVQTSRITNFAFNPPPNTLTAAPNAVSGPFHAVVNNATQPNGIGAVEVCWSSQGCPGGGYGGVHSGDSASGSATLYFAGAISAFTIDSAYLRYQGIDCDYGAACNPSASGSLTNTNSPVPEPSSFAHLSLRKR